MYRLHTPAQEVARSLLVVMRRGSLSAAEEVTGHQYETLGRWLRAAAGVGLRLGRLSQDRPTRFIVAGGFGPDEDTVALRVVQQTRQRTGQRGRSPLRTTPGAGLVQAVTQRCGGRVVRVELRVGLGAPFWPA